jgi:excisionase family DNA binding protein
MSAPLRIDLPPELVEQIARRAAELVAERNGNARDVWLSVADAAEYLRCTPSRVYSLVSARRIPFCKDGSRLLFRRSELDEWVQAGGAACPS